MRVYIRSSVDETRVKRRKIGNVVAKRSQSSVSGNVKLCVVPLVEMNNAKETNTTQKSMMLA